MSVIALVIDHSIHLVKITTVIVLAIDSIAWLVVPTRIGNQPLHLTLSSCIHAFQSMHTRTKLKFWCSGVRGVCGA